MEIFFIVILGIVVFVVWRSSQDTTEQLRGEIEGLLRDVGFLKDKLAVLLKAQTSTPSTIAGPIVKEEPPKKPEVAAPPAPPVESPRPAPPQSIAAHHAPPIPVAALKQTSPAPVITPPVKAEAPPRPASAEPSRPPVQTPEIPQPPVAAPKLAEPMKESAKPRKETEASGGGFSLEQRLGANWLNKLGIAILVIGLAFFLAYKLQTWGPGGKVLCGFAVSLLLLAGGVWLERKETYRIFARGGIGGGWALAFFTTYAMYHVSAAKVLESLVLDLVLMLMVAAGMVAHSLRYKSQTVTGLAFLLAFVTLLTSHLESAGTGDGTVVFSLIASLVLAVALVVVTTLRHWAWLELTGLMTVYLSHLVWLMRVLPENHAAFAEFWPSTALILLYWLVFRLAYVLRTPLDKNEENISSLSAVLNSIGVLGLLKYQSAHPEWAFWALIALGAVEMGLAFRLKSRRRQGFVVLSTIATILLVSAVPFKFHGVSWPVLWLIQAQVLAIYGLRLGEPVFRRLGLLAGLLTGGVLAFHDVLPLSLLRLSGPDTSRHASLTVALGLAATLYWIHAEVYPRHWPQIAENELDAFALKITSWLGAAAATCALWVALPGLWVAVGWLALVLVMVFGAHRVGAIRLALQADVLALGAAAALILHVIGPLAMFRLDNPDPSHHPAEAAVLALAALAYWIRSEAYPRVLRRLVAVPASSFELSGWQAAMLPVLSWMGVGTAAAALWVALPDLWLPVGWLALFLLVALSGQLLPSASLTLEADALALASGAVLIIHQILPIAALRLDHPDASHHPVQTTVFALAAIAYWVRSEAYPRALPQRNSAVASNVDLRGWQALALPITSFLGVFVAAAALWAALPAAWIVVGWLALVVGLGLAADWIKAQTLAVEADLLAAVSVCGLYFWDLWTQGWWDHKAPLIAAVALLYAGMRRRAVLNGSPSYVAPAYSWTATLLLAFAAADISSAVALTPIWAILSLALFEIGRFSKKGFLRWQGYFLVALAFGRYLASLFGVFEVAAYTPVGGPGFSLVHSLLLEVLTLAAAGYLLMERTRNRERFSPAEYIVGLAGDALGTLSIALWFAYRFPSRWVPVPGGEAWVSTIWAAMATVLLALAWLMRRRTFLFQGMALVIAAVARGIAIDLFADSSKGFWQGPLFHLGVTALILMAALPFAFKLRGDGPFDSTTNSLPPDVGAFVRHPEQLFFFSAFGLEVVALAFKLTSGHITIAWSLLGLGVFLFALAVGERSFRLAGLGLLLVSVAKILLMDVWKLSPSDRYTTLIVLGLALLAVSFLYTRFGKVIRKFL